MNRHVGLIKDVSSTWSCGDPGTCISGTPRMFVWDIEVMEP